MNVSLWIFPSYIFCEEHKSQEVQNFCFGFGLIACIMSKICGEPFTETHSNVPMTSHPVHIYMYVNHLLPKKTYQYWGVGMAMCWQSRIIIQRLNK